MFIPSRVNACVFCPLCFFLLSSYCYVRILDIFWIFSTVHIVNIFNQLWPMFLLLISLWCLIRQDWILSNNFFGISEDNHWKKKWQSTPVFLSRKPHGERSLAGYSPWGHKESDTAEQLHKIIIWLFLKFLVWLIKCTELLKPLKFQGLIFYLFIHYLPMLCKLDYKFVS